MLGGKDVANLSALRGQKPDGGKQRGVGQAPHALSVPEPCHPLLHEKVDLVLPALRTFYFKTTQ